MQLLFDRGEREAVRGHAILYFRAMNDRQRVFASYCVTLPIPLRLSRYVPPMFAAQFAEMAREGVSSMPLPPVAEEMESYAEIERLAEARGDDLVYAGSLNPDDAGQLMFMTAEASQTYTALYEERAAALAREHEPSPLDDLNVDALMYSILGDKEKLGELVKLVGKLRYAIEGHDKPGIAEARRELATLGDYLPERYQLGDILHAAERNDSTGAEACSLYLDRSYRIQAGDEDAVRELDEKIRALR